MHRYREVLILLLLLTSVTNFAAFQVLPEKSENSEKVYLASDYEEEAVYDNQSIGKIFNKEVKTALNVLVTLNFVNTNLAQVIKEISVQNKINFIYDDRLLNIKGITIIAEEQPLYEILNELLDKYNISYYEFAPGEIALAKQTRIDETTGGIKGTIKDEKGETLLGANIIIKELGIGTTSDFNGNYTIRKIKPGEYTLEISFVGYEKVTRRIKISAGALLELNFTLKETAFQIGGIEVVGTTDLLPRDVNTKTNITSGEIEHFQASSIKDVLDLVPGVQKSSNPGLGKTSQVALRGDEADNLSAFGTLIVIDGTPISNNANLQFEKASNSTLGSSNMRGGVDLRTIPADNIQNIEVITGLPSVRYGDATSGVINIKSKIGASPNRMKVKNNPDTREANFEGGMKLGDGALSYNLNAAQSSRDVRVTGDEYLRATGQVVYTKNFFNNSLNTNTKFLYQRILDEEEPHGDLKQVKNYNRGYTLSLSSWGNYNFDDGISGVEYNLYATLRRENSMKSKLVTDYVIVGNDTITKYIGKVETRGIEWTVGGRLEYTTAFYTGDIIHKFLIGAEPQYNANTGEGVMFDTLLNYYGQNSGRRPYSFDKVPGQFILGLYAEDKITGHFIFDFNLMLGVRYEMYRPYKFNLSGIWGDGNLIESHQGTCFNPRVNLMLYFSKVNQLRISAGISTKSPPMSMVYPEEDVTPWRNPIDKKNYYFRHDLWQSDLKGYRESMFEVSYDHKFFNLLGVTATGYYKYRNQNPSSLSIPIFTFAQLANQKYQAYYVDYYSKYFNIGITETKGLEFSIRSSKIEALNMDLAITGSYSFIKYPSTGYSWDDTPDPKLGEYPNYKVQSTLVDTLIGMTYPRSESWNDRFQINYSIRYTLPSLGLWITLRAEQLVFERNQSLSYKPFDFSIATQTSITDYYFYREIKTKPNKWLFSFNMSKSLFKGAEVSFYVNNFFDDPAIYRYYTNPTDQVESGRNPELFYGIEFSMIFDSFSK